MAATNVVHLPQIFTQKVIAVESSLQQTLKCFKDLVEGLNAHIYEFESYKCQFLSLKLKCDSEQSANENLHKEIENKDNVIQQIALSLRRLQETKNLNLVDDIIKLINISSEAHIVLSPKKEIEEKDFAIQDESVSEIEGTPTGRKSPIITSKCRNTSNGLSLIKKKCPDTWDTPEKKNIKLIFPSPSRAKPGCRMKQSRLNLVKVKSSNVVDLTCSPETLSKAITCPVMDIKVNIKKEPLDNDETIPPSPTSAMQISQVLQSKFQPKSSPMKFIKPSTPSKFKIEEDTALEECVVRKSSPTYTQHSNSLSKNCKKSLKLNSSKNENMECDADDSMSLLQQNKKSPRSPLKAPLIENNNVVNLQQNDIESSMSILQGNVAVNKISPNNANTTDKPKRLKAENVDHIYKEPTVRKKIEKRALRGWSCNECRDFYGELYKDNQQMLALKMDECSKHRGKNNPIRPKTPPGFWNPRWDVPEDTEEFNTRNNAL